MAELKLGKQSERPQDLKQLETDIGVAIEQKEKPSVSFKGAAAAGQSSSFSASFIGTVLAHAAGADLVFGLIEAAMEIFGKKESKQSNKKESKFTTYNLWTGKSQPSALQQSNARAKMQPDYILHGSKKEKLESADLHTTKDSVTDKVKGLKVPKEAAAKMSGLAHQLHDLLGSTKHELQQPTNTDNIMSEALKGNPNMQRIVFNMSPSAV